MTEHQSNVIFQRGRSCFSTAFRTAHFCKSENYLKTREGRWFIDHNSSYSHYSVIIFNSLIFFLFIGYYNFSEVVISLLKSFRSLALSLFRYFSAENSGTKDDLLCNILRTLIDFVSVANIHRA